MFLLVDVPNSEKDYLALGGPSPHWLLGPRPSRGVPTCKSDLTKLDEDLDPVEQFVI